MIAARGGRGDAVEIGDLRKGPHAGVPPRSEGPPLDEEDLKTLIQWIDMGAQFEAAKPSEPEARKVSEAK